MLKTIFKKFFSTSTLIISFQLCFSPLVFAQAQDGMSNSETKWNKVATGFSIGATVFNSAVAQVTQAEKQQRAAAYQQELGATLELRPVDQNQVPPVFSGCFVLPAKGNRLSQAKMCNAKTLQEVDAGYADAMISIAESNKNVVDNYLTKGNERFTTQGKGCYEKKLEDFNARLLAREEELNKYREKLKALMDNFELAAKNDLEGIKQTSALLNGGTKDNNYLKDFKFETVFLGNDANSACGSTFSAAEFARTGAQKNGGGLRGIEKMLFEKMNKPSNNSMSAAEVLTKSNQLSKEVDEIANKMSDHMKNRNSAEVSVDDISFSGRLLSKDNKALNRVVKNFNSELKNKIGDLESSTKFSTISGSNPIAAQVKAGNIDSQDLEKKLTRFNQQSRKSCLDSIIKSNFTSKENFAKSFKNPSISKGLSRDADNILTTSILSYWNSTDDINDLVTKIKKTESKGMNHLYRMTTGKSFKFDNNKTINASTPMRASQLLGILVSNCNSDFENKDSGNGYSNSDIANNIRTYANQQRQIKKIASYNLAKHIKDEMKSCPSDTTTGVAALSCSNALNSNDQNFCVRTATRCATNMSACYKKATEQIKTVRGNQDALIQKYNTNVEGFKTNMKKELLALNNYIENQARTFDSQLNVGSVFKVPAADFGLAKQSFIVDKKEGIGEDLKIQDPKTYLTNALVDIGKMEAAMKKQRHEYMGASGQDGKLGIIKKEYLANYAKEKAYWATIIADCQGRKQQV
ncbi:MAG: hypothetical protein HON90_03735, partial [Halobacteriovoraceae bacterium]|nr:hypothetical protein [Halobacteriovoraceae bacterium]